MKSVLNGGWMSPPPMAMAAVAVPPRRVEGRQRVRPAASQDRRARCSHDNTVAQGNKPPLGGTAWWCPPAAEPNIYRNTGSPRAHSTLQLPSSPHSAAALGVARGAGRGGLPPASCCARALNRRMLLACTCTSPALGS